MSTSSRSNEWREEPEDLYEAHERAMERAERELEAQIDSIAGNDATDFDSEAEASCTAARASAHRALAAAGVQLSNTPPQVVKMMKWIIGLVLKTGSNIPSMSSGIKTGLT